MNAWLQIAAVTELGLATLWERRASSVVAVVGIAGVVLVMVAVLSMGQGFRRALANSAAPDGAIVMRAGADTEMTSVMGGEEVKAVLTGPGIAPSADGPQASAELFVIIDLPKRTTGTDANVPLRGVGSLATRVRDGFRVVEGHTFEPGRNEVIAGVGAAREFAGLEIGSVLRVGPNQWTVVGLFTAEGGSAESEVWADESVLRSAYARGNSYQSVYVRLSSPAAFDAFKDALTADPRLSVKVVRQSEYFAEQSQAVSRLINGLGSLVAVLMAVGAVFGALNTMYTAVAARTREIATLRALGFGGAPVVVSVLLESLFLALVGGVLGGGLAYVVFDGFTAATMNWQTFSQVAFAFAVTPELLVRGILYATAIGLVGGLFPGLRAARMPVATALRES